MKLPGPNQPALEANSTSGSAIAAAITASAKQKPKSAREISTVDFPSSTDDPSERSSNLRTER